MRRWLWLGALGLACANGPDGDTDASAGFADVITVATSGAAGAYELAVAIRSPDVGCEQYANWWEVVSPEGELIYRRILGHSHVGEQPFTRSGGPVPLQADTEVIVRAWMHPSGYGGAAMRGSVAGGFVVTAVEGGWASGLSTEAPQPTGCAF